MPQLRFHASCAWSKDGTTITDRPVVEASRDLARDAAERLWGKAHAAGGTQIEATIYQVRYDETLDKDGRPALRETGRVFAGRIDSRRCWSGAADLNEVASPTVVEAWLAVLRYDLERVGKTGPALPPDDIRRAGSDAISDWYRARMDRATEDHIRRQGAVHKALNG